MCVSAHSIGLCVCVWRSVYPTVSKYGGADINVIRGQGGRPLVSGPAFSLNLSRTEKDKTLWLVWALQLQLAEMWFSCHLNQYLKTYFNNLIKSSLLWKNKYLVMFRRSSLLMFKVCTGNEATATSISNSTSVKSLTCWETTIKSSVKDVKILS